MACSPPASSRRARARRGAGGTARRGGCRAASSRSPPRWSSRPGCRPAACRDWAPASGGSGARGTRGCRRAARVRGRRRARSGAARRAGRPCQPVRLRGFPLHTGWVSPAIAVRGLAKSYGEIEAVRGIDFEVAAGETFGFLGPNGAGKTTTISMLCTLVRPSGGSASVAGHDVVGERDDVRRNIGLVFQDTTLDGYLTAEQNLRLHAELYGVPREAIAPRLRQVLDMVGLWDRRAGRVMTFSGGMKRRLEIARGLLHAPRVLFLDEPTVGLDPQTRASIWEYIEQLKQREDITIFLTTHYMDEAE